MNPEGVDLDDEEQEDAPPRRTKRKAYSLSRAEALLDSMPKPDLYRCKGCTVHGVAPTFTERDRGRHLAECPSPTSSDIEEAFEPRQRLGTKEQARKIVGAQMKRGRRKKRVELLQPAPPDDPWDQWNAAHLLVVQPPAVGQQLPHGARARRRPRGARRLRGRCHQQ